MGHVHHLFERTKARDSTDGRRSHDLPVCIETKQDQTLKTAESSIPVARHPTSKTVSVHSGDTSSCKYAVTDLFIDLGRVEPSKGVQSSGMVVDEQEEPGRLTLRHLA